jgi:integrase
MSDYLIQRGLFWHFFRWVPVEYADVDRRKIVSKSTKIRVADDPDRQRARRIADKINTSLEGYWRDLAAGNAAGAAQRFREATTRARRLGFDYVTTAELTAGPVAELLRRIEALEGRGLVPPIPTPDSMAAAEAVLGGVDQPRIMVSELYDRFAAHVRADIQSKSPAQKKHWENLRKGVIADFLTALGADKPLAQLTRTDANTFRAWWSDRIEGQGYNRDSANNQFGLLRVMCETIARTVDIDLGAMFDKMRFKSVGNNRPPFDTDFIATRLLAPGAMADLVDEARHAFYVMVETGLRPSELAGLDKTTIKLHGDIPHIVVVDEVDGTGRDKRELKNKNSRREIPLVGVALKAMQKHPNGFQRYYLKPNTLSKAVNRHLQDHDLLPTPQHSFYSLRHSFKDRLRAIEAPTELLDMLMGHSNNKPHYGKGYPLEVKRKWLQRIALPVPSRL